MEKELEYVYACVTRLSRLGGAPLFHNAVLPEGNVNSKVIPYYECDVKPSFLNSTDPRQFLSKWVYAYLKYPREALENGIQGTVMVVNLSDMNLRQISAMLAKVEQQPLVAKALLNVASSEDQETTEILDFTVTIALQPVEEEE